MEASRELIKIAEPQLTQKDLDNWLMGSDTKLNDKQKALFYQVALSFQLNPVKREIYAIAYGNNFNIITGYEVYLKRAERTGNLEWWDAGVKKDGTEWVGYCTVKRRDRTQPTTIEAWFSEYNQNNAIWKSKPRTMIRKVAIAQAFRMSFPDELGGMPYTSDEMGDVVQAEVVSEKKSTPTHTIKKEKSSHHEAPTQPEPQTQDSWDSRDADLEEIRGLLQETGTNEEKVLEHYKLPSLDAMAKDQAGKLMGILMDRKSAMDN
jgi:phage recombination protein Bet